MSDTRKRTKRTAWFGFDVSPSSSRPGWYEIREPQEPVSRIWWTGDQWRLAPMSSYQLSIVFCILHRVKWRGLAERSE